MMIFREGREELKEPAKSLKPSSMPFFETHLNENIFNE